ncbi:hypothetical protein B0H15DRAFT_299464 [Mycena belliarum]|uniref:Uncharacterized protein n=1 Tax=Mycena belliarum TaxID=1033014 RepID=A0AAD6U4L2_9AGAR|nr:hypothetical protein B0H15DRAFT_299464 [Mycena belliae]
MRYARRAGALRWVGWWRGLRRIFRLQALDDDIKAAPFVPLLTRCCDAEKMRYARRAGALRWVGWWRGLRRIFRLQALDDDIKAAPFVPLLTRCCDAEKMIYGRRAGALRWVDDGRGSEFFGFRRLTMTSRPRRSYRSLLGATTRRKRDARRVGALRWVG